MIYLSGADNPQCRELAQAYPVGVIGNPDNSVGQQGRYALVAADNGCFNAKWEETKWLRWLDKMPRSSLFAVVPDVVGDWRSTYARWLMYADVVKNMGFKTAYVLQNGQPWEWVPVTADAVFIGGDTAWKLGVEAAYLTLEAQHRGQWVHMGRANSLKRLKRASEMHCDSCDGTFLKYGPKVNALRLEQWLLQLPRDTQLALA